MTVGSEVIGTKSSVKYLGIRLDPRLTFLYQIQYSANKAQKIVGQLSKLMANIGGQLPARPRLLVEVANSIMLYACEIWAETLDIKKRANSLVSVQRTAALRIASAYRTMSVSAVHDSKYNPYGSAGGRADGDLKGVDGWKSHNWSLQ